MTDVPAMNGIVQSPIARLPVIYVRGYAGGPSSIDRAVDDPFYGFNDGSTHVRVGGDGEPLFHQFESPLLRLMLDEAYRLEVHGDQVSFLEGSAPDSLEPNSIWVHRFYDAAAGTYGQEREAFDIVRAAESLYELIKLVRDRTKGSPKVHLVAHSMGGLVCRTLLQKVCREQDEAGQMRMHATELVDRVVTLGTPHGGIETRSVVADLFNELVGVWGSEIFSRRRMYGYLTPNVDRDALPPDGWRPSDLGPDAFPRDRVLCIVGTNPSDYSAGFDTVRHAVGIRSDGLVRIDNAYVRGAPRAFVHRAHSGRYGLVNSEEAYQSVRRFLFGSCRVEVQLGGVNLRGEANGSLASLQDHDLLEKYQRWENRDREFDPPGEREYWQADVQLTIRGLPVVLHEQAVDKHCPVQLTDEQRRRRIETELARRGLLEREDVEAADSADTPVPLTTAFLLDPQRFMIEEPGTPPPPRARYTLRLRVFRLQQRGRFLGLRQHLEQVADWEDALIVDIGRGSDPDDERIRAWMAWNSEIVGAIADRDPIVEDDGHPLDAGTLTVPLPGHARAGIFGEDAHLRLRVAAWPPAPPDEAS